MSFNLPYQDELPPADLTKPHWTGMKHSEAEGQEQASRSTEAP